MLYDQTTFIGIDPTAGVKPFTYAALDQGRRLLALGRGNLDDILAFVAGQRRAFAAVCAPRQPNQGVMQRADLRRELSPAPAPGRWLDFRLAEYLLRQHNISAPQTPRSADACPNWMKTGFTLHRRLHQLGYTSYPSPESERQSLEVYPHASYTVLLGVAPFSKYSLEGRIQRQLVLQEQKINVPDPMRFFEEITRHRLLHGMLPADDLYSEGELDALVASLTAWLAAHHPEQICLLGDEGEGQIALPAPALRERY